MLANFFFPDSHLPGYFPGIQFGFIQKRNYFLAVGLQCFTIEFVAVERWKFGILYVGVIGILNNGLPSFTADFFF